MKVNKILAFDFDEVIADTGPYKKWYIDKERRAGFEGEIGYEIKTKMYSDIKASLEKIEFIDGSIETLKKMIQLGFNTRIVTSRSGESLKVPHLLLNRVGLDIPIFGVGYRQSKLPHLHDCYSFVDDDPRNLYELIGKVPKIFLMSSEDNREEECADFIRIESLCEMMEILMREM